eukprot:7328242-Pyramimonas_sp.AAC.1
MKSVYCLPPDISAVALAFPPKPTGGHRPIGAFCPRLRVWGRRRRPFVLSWEQQRPGRCRAAGQFRGATDAVWRQ